LDLCYQKLPVTLIGIGGGVSYGLEGPSHFAIEDLAMARSLPDLRVIAPGDPAEVRAAMKATARNDGPVFIRLGLNNDPDIHMLPVDRIDRPMVVQDGDPRITLVATGHILANAWAASKRLLQRGISAQVVSLPQIKPMDEGYIRALAKKSEHIFTVEEHSTIGGLGTAIGEVLLEEKFGGTFTKLGLPDEFCQVVGSHDFMLEYYQLDSAGIAAQVTRTVRSHVDVMGSAHQLHLVKTPKASSVS
jgi:transketolase